MFYELRKIHRGSYVIKTYMKNFQIIKVTDYIRALTKNVHDFQLNSTDSLFYNLHKIRHFINVLNLNADVIHMTILVNYITL